MEKEVQNALSSLMKQIRKEIKKGSIESHISFKQEGDTFSLISKLKHKPVKVQTWNIPQEDRDSHMTLLKQLNILNKTQPFTRLIQDIKSSRHLIHNDEVWKKNMIDFLGESYDLSKFADIKLKSKPDLDTLLNGVHLSKRIQNTSTERTEKNKILQSLYQALIQKDFSESRNVKQYKTLSNLMNPKKIIHEIKKEDGTIEYVEDGIPFDGELIKTYSSLKQFRTQTFTQKDERVIGAVLHWKQLKQKLSELGINVMIFETQIVSGATHFIVANRSSRESLGEASFEGFIEGHSPIGGESARQALNYENSTLPSVIKGVLYRSRLHAILSIFTEGLEIGGANEDATYQYLWNQYKKHLSQKDTQKILLKQEKDVLIQNWNIHSNQFNYLKTLWKEGVKPFAYHLHNQTLYAGVSKLLKLIMSQKALDTSFNTFNQTKLLNWIFKNTSWIQIIKRGEANYLDKNIKSLKEAIELSYEITLSDVDEEILEKYVKIWKHSEPVKWSSKSLEESLEESGFMSPRVSSDELVVFVRDYGTTLWSKLKQIEQFSGVEDKYGSAIVLMVFLSILHPNSNKHVSSPFNLLSAREGDKILHTITVTSVERNIIRNQMERFGVTGFELPISEDREGGGASESKGEDYDIEVLELGRVHGLSDVMNIKVDSLMEMRLV